LKQEFCCQKTFILNIRKAAGRPKPIVLLLAAFFDLTIFGQGSLLCDLIQIAPPADKPFHSQSCGFCAAATN
jgi:hypothetical protein